MMSNINHQLWRSEKAPTVKLLKARDCLRIIEGIIREWDIVNAHAISLVDKHTLQRIKRPCRSLYCKHLQCFDYSSYVDCNRNVSPHLYQCPVCGSSANPTKVYGDAIWTQLLKEFPTDSSLYFHSDGTCSVTESKAAARNKTLEVFDVDSGQLLIIDMNGSSSENKVIHLCDLIVECDVSLLTSKKKSLDLTQLTGCTIHDVLHYLNSQDHLKVLQTIGESCDVDLISPRPFVCQSMEALVIDIAAKVVGHPNPVANFRRGQAAVDKVIAFCKEKSQAILQAIDNSEGVRADKRPAAEAMPEKQRSRPRENSCLRDERHDEKVSISRPRSDSVVIIENTPPPPPAPPKQAIPSAFALQSPHPPSQPPPPPPHLQPPPPQPQTQPPVLPMYHAHAPILPLIPGANYMSHIFMPPFLSPHGMMSYPPAGYMLAPHQPPPLFVPKLRNNPTDRPPPPPRAPNQQFYGTLRGDALHVVLPCPIIFSSDADQLAPYLKIMERKSSSAEVCGVNASLPALVNRLRSFVFTSSRCMCWPTQRSAIGSSSSSNSSNSGGSVRHNNTRTFMLLGGRSKRTAEVLSPGMASPSGSACRKRRKESIIPQSFPVATVITHSLMNPRVSSKEHSLATPIALPQHTRFDCETSLQAEGGGSCVGPAQQQAGSHSSSAVPMQPRESAQCSSSVQSHAQDYIVSPFQRKSSGMLRQHVSSESSSKQPTGNNRRCESELNNHDGPSHRRNKQDKQEICCDKQPKVSPTHIIFDYDNRLQDEHLPAHSRHHSQGNFKKFRSDKGKKGQPQLQRGGAPAETARISGSGGGGKDAKPATAGHGKGEQGGSFMQLLVNEFVNG